MPVSPIRRPRPVLLTITVLCAGLVSGAATVPAGPVLAAQSAPIFSSDGTRADTRHLTLTTSAGSREVRRGARVSLFVDITPKAKMHVYSPAQKDVIPVAVKIEPVEGLRIGSPRYPRPEQYFFAPLKETQLVYSKPFRLTQDVTVEGSAGPSLTIKGTLRYQACDEAICYLPQNVPVSWTLAVQP